LLLAHKTQKSLVDSFVDQSRQNLEDVASSLEVDESTDSTKICSTLSAKPANVLVDLFPGSLLAARELAKVLALNPSEYIL
jgi:hypothetical protein